MQVTEVRVCVYVVSVRKEKAGTGAGCCCYVGRVGAVEGGLPRRARLPVIHAKDVSHVGGWHRDGKSAPLRSHVTNHDVAVNDRARQRVPVRCAQEIMRRGVVRVTIRRVRADGIIVLGECMKERLISAGVPSERIHIAQNWASDQIRSLLSQPARPLRILYSGNLGMAHEVQTIDAVLETLANEESIQFLFAGGGAARPGLEQRCRAAKMSNVTFQSYGDNQAFAENLQSCHVGLVTLRNGCEGTVVPSKVYSLMSVGRPILFIGPKNSTAALLVREHQCGWQFDPGKAAETSAFLRSLSADPHRIAEAGRNARRAFEQHYNRAHGTERLLQTLLGSPC